MKKIMILPIMILATTVSFYSCKKKDSTTTPAATTAQMNMHLTDGPSVYDNVYLDIQQVEITMSGSAAVTYAPFRKGVYDIMKFRNGLDTLLMQTTLPTGTISQIRLILGSNNSIVVDGVAYALNTPSAQESGVKLNLNQTMVANGVYDIWVDFDAAKSIVLTGAGVYKLKPVISAYSASVNGRIKGYILPLNAKATVYAINGTDTVTAIPNSVDGYFRISGLSAATYRLWVSPGILGLQVYNQTNIQVNAGTEVTVGTVTLLP
jgi:hypothetical protein